MDLALQLFGTQIRILSHNLIDKHFRRLLRKTPYTQSCKIAYSQLVQSKSCNSLHRLWHRYFEIVAIEQLSRKNLYTQSDTVLYNYSFLCLPPDTQLDKSLRTGLDKYFGSYLYKTFGKWLLSLSYTIARKIARNW